jgi:putative NADPH-quinone reductase
VAAQKSIAWANHVVVLYPLWLGTMPARLKGFFEQVMRPGFAFAERGPGQHPKRLLKGRSARIIVTRGMPQLFDEVDRSPRSIRNVASEVLGICGVRPVRTMVIEGTDMLTDVERDKAHYDMRRLGALAR